MIKEDDTLIYITNEEGKEEPYKILKEFEREENHKHFIFYSPIEDDSSEVFVAEIVPTSSGEGEIAEIEDEDDMVYCQDVFDDFLAEIESEELSDDEEEEEE